MKYIILSMNILVLLIYILKKSKAKSSQKGLFTITTAFSFIFLIIQIAYYYFDDKHVIIIFGSMILFYLALVFKVFDNRKYIKLFLCSLALLIIVALITLPFINKLDFEHSVNSIKMSTINSDYPDIVYNEGLNNWGNRKYPYAIIYKAIDPFDEAKAIVMSDLMTEVHIMNETIPPIKQSYRFKVNSKRDIKIHCNDKGLYIELYKGSLDSEIIKMSDEFTINTNGEDLFVIVYSETDAIGYHITLNLL